MNRRPIQTLTELKDIVVRCRDHKYLEVLGLLIVLGGRSIILCLKTLV
jgi:hypothetical protein